jgi:hypothetical protein
MNDIREQSNSILGQVFELIESINIEQYSMPLSSLSHSSVGMHFRHIVEFYQCLFNGISEGSIDYDKRERNLLLETNKKITLETILNITEYTRNILDNPLLLNMNYGENNYSVNTSIFRELAYNIEHTIHHLAIIKIGLTAHYPEILLPENLGVANSTIKYKKEASSLVK